MDKTLNFINLFENQGENSSNGSASRQRGFPHLLGNLTLARPTLRRPSLSRTRKHLIPCHHCSVDFTKVF
jgi:hypothetical protein